MNGMTREQWDREIVEHYALACVIDTEASVLVCGSDRKRDHERAQRLQERAARHAVTAAVMAALTPGREIDANRLARGAAWKCAGLPRAIGGPGIRLMFSVAAEMRRIAERGSR